jgi:hypothetical protein
MRAVGRLRSGLAIELRVHARAQEPPSWKL